MNKENELDCVNVKVVQDMKADDHAEQYEWGMQSYNWCGILQATSEGKTAEGIGGDGLKIMRAREFWTRCRELIFPCEVS